MPPKSQDSTILNAIRLARTQPVTFGKGLIRTDDNSILGYVSDLNNMEVDRNGNVRRRKGTVAMNSGKLNDKWYFLESYQIAGVPILFGLSYKRELWAWIDTWPEVDIKVCDKNTYGRFPHYSANSTDPVFNTWVSFSRGSSFHVLKTDRHITIVNNLNDAIRIYSKGCFALAAYKEDVTQVFMKEDIDIVRDNPEIELAMYLSIKDVTNKIIEPAITIKTDDTGPLIEGTIQFASINEEGTAGRFTDPQKIEKSSPAFSLFDVISSDRDGSIIQMKSRELEAIDGVQTVSPGEYARTPRGFASSPTQPWTPEYSLSPSSDYTKITMGVTIIQVETFDYLDGIGWDMINDEQEGTWILFDGVDRSVPETDIPQIINSMGYFKIKDIMTLSPKTSDFAKWSRTRNLGNDLVYLDTSLGTTGYRRQGFYFHPNDVTEITYNVADDKFTYNISTSHKKCFWYRLTEADFDYKVHTCNTSFIFGDSTEIRYATTRKAAVFFAYIDVYQKKSNPLDYYTNEIAIVYNNWFTKYGYDNIAEIKSLGFNHFEINKFNITTDLIGFHGDKNKIEYIVNPDSFYIDNTSGKAIGSDGYVSKGNRWCVKNGDKIIAVSQKGYLNQTSDRMIYSISPSDIPENFNQLPFELKPCFLPIISLEGSSFMSYIDQDKNREVFYDVQYAFNVDNKLLVIQDGAIWVGDTNTLKLTYDKAIQGAVLCADKFYGGLLIGTTDGLYFYNQGQLTNVIDGQAIIAKGIRSGVNGALVIDEYGRPQYITVQINEGGIYGRLLDISQPVSDIVFDGINMIFVDGVFYVAQDDKVFGLTVYREEGGLLAVWGRVYVWEGQKISLIANHNNRLVVAFETGAVKSEVFEQPWDSGISKW